MCVDDAGRASPRARPEEETRSTDAAPSYFVPVADHTYRPTSLTQGAWREDEQHVSVLAGLAAHEIEQHEPRADLLACRFSFEILGQIAREEISFEVRTARPGRTIELVEAVGTIGPRPVLLTRAWRLLTSDTTTVEGIELPAMPKPQDCEPFDGAAQWQGEFLASLEWLAAPGGRDGRRQVWTRTPVDLVEGVEVGDLARFVSLVDLANGVATRRHPKTMGYPNVELSIHLLRRPDPEWVGLDTSVSFGPDGVGLTSTVLNDVHGPVGTAAQSLTLRLP